MMLRLGPRRFAKVSWILIVIVLAALPVFAQVSLQSGTTDFGVVAVGKANTITLTYSFSSSVTLGNAPDVVTLGSVGIDLDFTNLLADGNTTGTCLAGQWSQGSTCTVVVTLEPRYPGLRMGGVLFIDDSGNIISTTYLHGVGSGSMPTLTAGVSSSSYSFDLTGAVTVDGAGTAYVGGVQSTGYAGLWRADILGGPINGSTSFSYANAATIDGAGNIYVLDWSRPCVWQITPSVPWGSNLTTNRQTNCYWTPPGSVDLGATIAVDGEGNFYVADNNTGSVLKVASDGTYVTFATGFVYVSAIALDAAGNLYVADWGRTCGGAPGEYECEGTDQVWEVVSGTNAPVWQGAAQNLALDGAGNLYIVDYSNHLWKVPSGQSPMLVDTADQGLADWRPWGIAIDGPGNAYVTDPTSAEQSATLYKLSGVNYFTAVAPVAGACGTANNQPRANAPAAPAELCSAGTASSVSGSGPWIWSCAGVNGGATASCSANVTSSVVDGACGADNGGTLSAPPAAAGLCSIGTASAISGSGPWNWSCAGLNGGSKVACTANLSSAASVDGVCGLASGISFAAAPGGDLCLAGMASSVSGGDSGPWTWSCAGLRGGATVSCSTKTGANACTPGTIRTIASGVTPSGLSVDGTGTVYFSSGTYQHYLISTPSGPVLQDEYLGNWTAYGSHNLDYASDTVLYENTGGNGISGPAPGRTGCFFNGNSTLTGSTVADSSGNLYLIGPLIDNNQFPNVLNIVPSGDTCSELAVVGGLSGTTDPWTSGTVGTGCAGETDEWGDGCPGTSAPLSHPDAVAVDGNGNLYIWDSNGNSSLIRMWNPQTQIVSAVAAFSKVGPALTGAVSPSGDFYFNDSKNVYQVDASSGTVSLLNIGGLKQPVAIAMDRLGTLYVADAGTSQVIGVSGPDQGNCGVLNPVNAACGTGNGAFLTAAPATNLCALGAASAVSGDGPWNWTCAGVNHGSSASCSASPIPVNGLCGTANGQFFTTAPGTNLCAAGTASTVLGSGPFAWSCAGLNGGTTANFCSSAGGSPSYIVEFTVNNARGGTLSGTTTQIVSPGGGTTPVTATPTSGYYFFDWTDNNGNIVSTSTVTVPNVTANLGLTANFVLLPAGGTCPAAGIITTIAGTGASGYNEDNIAAVAAELNGPGGVAVDNGGNVFILDADNYRVRKLTAATGMITTVAGNGTYGNAGDGGLAVLAEFGWSAGIAVDTSGNIYISDDDYSVIRKVDAETGNISTVAGGGDGCSSYPCSATSAGLENADDVTIDAAGNLYIADSGCGTDGCIWKVSGGSITPLNGTDYAYVLALDGKGNVYFADWENAVVRMMTPQGTVTTVAGGGNGCAGQTDSAGDGCTATSVALTGIEGLAVDRAGNLYIRDSNGTSVRRVDVNTGIITTVAGGPGLNGGDGGPATNAALGGGMRLAVDSAGNLYIPEESNEDDPSPLFSAVREVWSGSCGGGSAQQPQTITFSNPGTQTYGVSPITLTASAASGLPVSYSVTSGPASVNANVLTITGAGSVTVQAAQAGNASWQAAPSVSVTFTVDKAAQAALTIAGPGSVTYGATGTATASGGSGAGALSFSAGNSTGCSVSGATVSVTNASGTCVLTATQAADNNYNAVISAPYTVALSKGQQATLAVIGPSSVSYGATGTATVSGGNGTGALTFSAGSSTGCSVSGATVSVTNASNTCVLTATRAADNNYNAVTSAPYTVALSKGQQVTLAVTGPGSVSYGATGTATVSGGSGTGALTFSAGSSTGCSVSGATVSVTNASNTCVLTASQAADTNYNAATSAAYTVTLNKGQQATLTLTGMPASAQAFGATFTVGATGGSGTGAVAFIAAGACSLSGITVTMTKGTGSCSVTANKAADNNYAGVTSAAITVDAVQSAVTGTTPVIVSLSPLLTTAGSAGFTLTVTGTNFESGATVQWNGSSRTTTVVSAEQVTATITAADVASVGTAEVKVANPAPNGGTSVASKFAIDGILSGSGSHPTASAQNPALNVSAGQSIGTAVTFSGMTANSSQVTGTCWNLPLNATCSYNNGTQTVTVQTAASTPPGNYQTLVVFTVAGQSAALSRHGILLASWTGLMGLPLGLLWMGPARKKRALRLILIGLLGSWLALSLASCGGRHSIPAPTQGSLSAQSSLTITLNVQ
jgi:hypothetical protein